MMNMLQGMAGPGQRIQGWGLFLMGLIVTLGQWSEAIDLINTAAEATRSRFTNTVEYERLQRIHVGNSIEYVEGVLGKPEVIRDIDEQVSANYFFDEKYLLTLFYRVNRVVALTILARRDDFNYAFDGDHELASTHFAEFPEPKEYAVDSANTGSYYVEALALGRVGMFFTRYLGLIDYSGAKSEEIAKIYKADLLGEEHKIRSVLTKLRKQGVPNFYGEGELPLEALQKSLLTPVEFTYYRE